MGGPETTVVDAVGAIPFAFVHAALVDEASVVHATRSAAVVALTARIGVARDGLVVVPVMIVAIMVTIITAIPAAAIVVAIATMSATEAAGGQLD